MQLYGGAGIQQNLYVGGSIYIGNSDSNTDPLYISRINSSGLNITELSMIIGDDGVASSSLSTFPPTTEAFPTDYFTIRTSNVTNPFHAFSSTGSYYCSKNIYCTNINGTLIPTNSGSSITGINYNYMIFNSPSNGGVQFNNNNTEMLRIYKNYSTNINYIGNGSGNNFIINTGYGAIISKSMHTSANYSNT